MFVICYNNLKCLSYWLVNADVCVCECECECVCESECVCECVCVCVSERECVCECECVCESVHVCIFSGRTWWAQSPHNCNEPDWTVLNSSSVPAFKEQEVYRSMFQFGGAQVMNIGHMLYESHCLDCYSLYFIFRFRSPDIRRWRSSGGERTSICRNTPNCSKVEQEIPSMC
jgi:hypothetical protein